ncbi:MAG: cytochrome b/b6 domain-containing protein [Nitrososphaerota archaeon]|nr:cytochrome b/b6 domain-containing protein [Nitrososphaerota archaeon]
MQSSASSSVQVSVPPESQSKTMFRARTAISGVFLLVLGIFYVGFIDPLASGAAVVGNYRYPFSFEANIYTVFFVLYAIHFFYRLARPAKATYGQPTQIGADRILGMALRTAFLVAVGGSYLTGTMVSTPAIYAFATSLAGGDIVGFAQNLHLTFALALVVLGVALVAYEIVRIARHKQTTRELFFGARYPWIKVLYWAIFIGVIIQGTLGILLAGTVSPIGPFAIIGPNAYGVESLVRHIHGPFAAVLISIFYGHLYMRIRPEFHLR